MQPRPVYPSRPFVWGHRGTRALAPENTLPAFDVAVTHRLDGVELDVQLTADGVVAVMHDQELERTTDGRGWLGARTWEELQRLDAGSWFGPQFAGTRVPSFAAVLEHLPASMWVNVEIKNAPHAYPGLVEKVAALLREHGRAGRAVITSFDHTCLARARAVAPEILRAPLYAARLEEPWLLAERYGAYGLHVHSDYVLPGDVQAIRARDLMVNAWAVGSRETMRRVIEAGATGFTLDDPRWAEGIV